MLYRDVRVFVTGHTGFKGGWLCTWLKREGAIVSGFSLRPETSPSLFESAQIAKGMTSVLGDIRDFGEIDRQLADAAPDIVFHLAAQPLVRRSYSDPIGTFSSNVLGTVNVLEAARRCASVRAIVCVTTDKVYKDDGSTRAYSETDSLGGADPYSASKACAELVAECYAAMTMQLAGSAKIATVRGGNVLGGGDWSDDRLIPDVVRACFNNQPVVLRNPNSVRPWQHVLELVHAYLYLGQKLLTGDDATGPWNVGPHHDSELTTQNVVHRFLAGMNMPDVAIQERPSPLKETSVLRLNSSKVNERLHWQPVLSFTETIDWTAEWYKDHRSGDDAHELIQKQIARYTERRDSNI